MTDSPRCIYCGDKHSPVFAEHECPNSMGLDAASVAMTEARRRLLTPRGAERIDDRGK